LGHTRLGSIPKTRKWKAIVSFLANSDAAVGIAPAQIPVIASNALAAAVGGLNKAVDDEGLTRSLLLLVKILQASRAPDPATELDSIGIHLDEDATAFETISQFQDLLDRAIAEHGPRTDIGEIAQQAVGETLAAVLRPLDQSLFETGRSDVLKSLWNASTKAGFASAGRTFFASFMKRFLNFYLSRATASLISSPALAQIGAVTEFNQALQLHCLQSARIVETYAGDWYSKTSYEGGIDASSTRHFISVAFKKLANEFSLQGRCR
jgi:hypothetical protein